MSNLFTDCENYRLHIKKQIKNENFVKKRRRRRTGQISNKSFKMVRFVQVIKTDGKWRLKMKSKLLSPVSKT